MISTDSFRFRIFFLIWSEDESFWIISNRCDVAADYENAHLAGADQSLPAFVVKTALCVVTRPVDKENEPDSELWES